MAADMTVAGIAQLRADEGDESRLYQDVSGNWSIGVGRNLTACGIRPDESALMFANDRIAAINFLSEYDWFRELPQNARRDALVNAAFNLGPDGFRGFVRMIAALVVGDWDTAAAELLNSDAARELPGRYQRLAAAMRRDTWNSAP